MKLYELEGRYETLAAIAADATDPADVQMFTDTLEGITDEIKTKVIKCAAVVKTLEAQETAIAAAKKHLTDRANAVGSAIDRIKRYMKNGMETAKLESVKGNFFTVALQNNPPKVKVEDEAAVPETFKKTTVTVQVAEIRKQLLNDVAVPGASLEYTRGLRIR